MSDHIDILGPDEEFGGYDLYMPADVPGDPGVEAAGHVPNGYFWESLLAYLVETKAPDLAEEYEADSESDTFGASSEDRTVIERLVALIAPYVEDAALVEAIVTEAEAAGFEFDD